MTEAQLLSLVRSLEKRIDRLERMRVAAPLQRDDVGVLSLQLTSVPVALKGDAQEFVVVTSTAEEDLDEETGMYPAVIKYYRSDTAEWLENEEDPEIVWFVEANEEAVVEEDKLYLSRQVDINTDGRRVFSRDLIVVGGSGFTVAEDTTHTVTVTLDGSVYSLGAREANHTRSGIVSYDPGTSTGQWLGAGQKNVDALLVSPAGLTETIGLGGAAVFAGGVAFADYTLGTSAPVTAVGMDGSGDGLFLVAIGGSGIKTCNIDISAEGKFRLASINAAAAITDTCRFSIQRTTVGYLDGIDDTLMFGATSTGGIITHRGSPPSADGQIPIGSSAGAVTLATITAGSGITVTNGAGSITIAATGGGSGTVTSVNIAYTGASFLTVGSAVTSSGNISVTWTGTLGDILYASATNTWSKLSGNTTLDQKVLTQTGNGTISAAPTWLSLASIPGVTTWVKVATITFADFSVTGTFEEYFDAYTPSVGEMIINVALKLVTPFDNGSATAVTMYLGRPGSEQGFLSKDAFNVSEVGVFSAYGDVSSSGYVQGDPIRTGISVNLGIPDDLTVGAYDVYVQRILLP